MRYTISDLRVCSSFCNDVTDRIWHEWWRPRCMSREHVAHRVRENLNAKPIPTALVAHDGALFLGTASVILSDLSERQHLSPWVAAVWVDPDARRKGVGGALVDAASRAAFDAGHDVVYLGALPDRTDFYEKRGWRVLEKDIGATRLSVLTRGRHDKR